MSEKRKILLGQMQPGQSGTVVRILGEEGEQGYDPGPGPRRRRRHRYHGHRWADRLYALGLRPGKRITKVSSMFLQGPIVVEVDNAQLAIGFDMAGRIVVEVDQGG